MHTIPPLSIQGEAFSQRETDQVESWITVSRVWTYRIYCECHNVVLWLLIQGGYEAFGRFTRRKLWNKRREKHVLLFVINDIHFNVFAANSEAVTRQQWKHPLITSDVNHLTWARREKRGCCREIAALLSICPSFSPPPSMANMAVLLTYEYTPETPLRGYRQAKAWFIHSVIQLLSCFLSHR